MVQQTVQITEAPMRLSSRLQFIDFARGLVMNIMEGFPLFDKISCQEMQFKNDYNPTL